MHNIRNNWSDQRIETLIGDLLRAGVVLAAIVTLMGGVLYLARDGNTRPEYKVFHGEPADLRGIGSVISACAACAAARDWPAAPASAKSDSDSRLRSEHLGAIVVSPGAGPD